MARISHCFQTGSGNCDRLNHGSCSYEYLFFFSIASNTIVELVASFNDGRIMVFLVGKNCQQHLFRLFSSNKRGAGITTDCPSERYQVEGRLSPSLPKKTVKLLVATPSDPFFDGRGNFHHSKLLHFPSTGSGNCG